MSDELEALRASVGMVTRQDGLDGAALRLLEEAAALRYLSVAFKSEPEQGNHWRVKLVDKYGYDASPGFTARSIAEAADECSRALLKGDE